MNTLDQEYVQDINNIINTFQLAKIPSKTFLITGANGLVGSSIIDILIQLNERYHLNHKLHVVSRNKQNLSVRFEKSKNREYFNFMELDMSKKFELEQDYDYIIHAASNAGPDQFTQFPVETITTNVIGVQQLLEHAKKSGNTRLMYISTREVYGLVPNKNDYQESDYGSINFNELRSNYPESKRISELLCRSYYSQYGLDCVLTRLGYVYGPAMLKTDSRVISQFLHKAISKEDIILKSSGQQKRSYCYSLDAASGILMALFYGKSGEAYNVADQKSEITILELAKLIAKLSKVNIKYEEPTEDEVKGYSRPQDALLDTAKLQLLGWRPMTQIQDGLVKTINILCSDL